MKRTTITLAALVVALLPAGAGLWGNASFSEAVPVRVPASAQVATGAATLPTSSRTTEAGDDHGGDTPRDQRTEAGDDRGHSSASSTHTLSGTSTHTSSGTSTTDDHGGDTPRDQRIEPGDDRGSSTSGRSGSGRSDDSGHHGGSSGSGRSGSDDRGGHGGHGSDD